MAIQITTLSAGNILIQTGRGIPNHLAPKGSQFTDIETSNLYFNKDGSNNWQLNVDITNTGSTIGVYTFSSFSSSTVGQSAVSATTYTDNLTFSGINLSILVDSSNKILTLSAETPSNYAFTGGTVNGTTNFTNGLNANVFSAATYLNLPIDVRVTGGTLTNGTATFTNNTGGTFTVSGFKTDDVFVTGGTYSNGVATFTNNTGGTFTISGFKNNDVFVTGGTYSNGTATFTNNTGGTFTVTGFKTDDITVTGGTYSNTTGITTFTNNTGGTFTISGYFKPTDDIYTTGMTFNSSNYNLTITRNDGTSYSQSLAILASDMTITGGTYNSGTGIATFTNNTGGTFTVSGFLTGMTDTYTTGFTYSNNTLTLKRNASQPDLSVLINTMTGLTVTGGISATTISATTFYGNGSNLTGLVTQDTTVTGGTYSSGNILFTNNTGGTFTVSGLSTGYTLTSSAINTALGYTPLSAYTDTFVTGGTYANGTATLTNNTGGTFTITGFKTDDIFVTGGTYSTGSILFTNNTGGTFTVNGLSTGYTLTSGGIITALGYTPLSAYTDTFVTGGTYSNGNILFVNNTGGTFNVSGLSTGYTLTSNGITTALGYTPLSAYTDTFVTGGTYSNGTAIFTNNTGGTFNVTGFKTDDIYATGMTFNPSNYNLTITRNDGNSFTENLAILASDMTITGGTYNPNNGVATFTNNTGGTFTVSGFLTGQTDTYVTGFTYSNNVFTVKQTNSQADLSVLVNTMTGLTATTLYTDYIDFNTGATVANQTARLSWDNGNGTLAIPLKGGNVNLQIGQENVVLCYNSETTPLVDGEIVYVYSSQGNRPSVKRAIATGDGYSVTTLGMVTENIASGAEGFITTFGMVNDLDTSSYSAGTAIWLSPTVAGGFTNVKPQAPYHTVLLGYVVRVHASVGSIFVHISNGWEIDELHDVRINDKVQGDLLTLSAYNGTDVWVNSKTLNGSYTMTGLTVQGNSSSDLVRVTQTGTGNAFVVEDTTNPDATQFVIDTTGKVGIGLTNPEYILDIVSSGGTTSFENISRFRTIDSTDYLSITNAVSTDGSFNPILRSFNNTNISPNFYIQSVISPSVDTGINPLLVIQGRVSTDPGNVAWSGVTTRPILRVANNTSNLIEVTSNGNFGIGTITPTQKLDVRGNALVSSGLTATTVSATTYQNLPIDVRVTGATYSNNTFTYTNNTGGTFNVLFNTVTGLTVNGDITITGNTNISGSSTTVGDVRGFSLVSTQSVGDEGGEIRLSTAQTNTSLSGGTITFDVYQNKLRFFESGGSNRGVYIDLTAAGAGVSTNLLSGGGGEINTASNLGSGTGLFAQKSAADLQFKSLTSTGGTVTISNNSTTVNLEVVPASNFTGGTVNGATRFTNGLTANTFSATTYFNLPTDVRVTGGTYNSGTGIATFTNNTGGTFTVSGFGTGSGTFTGGTVSGATYFTGGVSANTLTTSGTGQNILTVIGSGNSTSSPIFSVIGSQGELFSVSDSLTGSLFSVNDISGLPIVEVFSDNTILLGSYQAPSLNTTKKLTLTAGTNTVYSIPTSGYTGAFFDYTVISSTGARAGTIMSIWSGTTAQYTDVTTNDIGSTAGISFSVSVVGSNAVLSSSATTTGWTLKTILRSI